MVWCRIASSAEETLRARLAQREQRLAELSAALGSMQSRAAEGRRRSSHSADERCQSMMEAAARAEPLLRRLSGDGRNTGADPSSAAQRSVLPLGGPASGADNGQAGTACSDLACDDPEDQGDSACPRDQEAQPAPDICQHDNAGANQQLLGATDEPGDHACTLSEEGARGVQPGLQRPPQESLQLTAAAGPSTVLSASDEGRGTHGLGVSGHAMRLAEDAEDLRLELAQRTAQAAGLQSRVDHLMACLNEHELTGTSQAAQLAAQSKVSIVYIYGCVCMFHMEGQQVQYLSTVQALCVFGWKY